MSPEKKKIIPLIFAAFMFLLSGVDAIQSDVDLLIYSCFIIAFVNMISIKFINLYPMSIVILLHFLDSIGAFLVAIVMVQSGKQYIQYAWFLTSLLYFIAAFISFKKMKTK